MTEKTHELPVDVKEELKICDFYFWTLYLMENQQYLGGSIIMLKRPEKVTYNQTLDEGIELFDIQGGFEMAVVKLFGAEHVDYDSSGGFSKHLRFKAIPRYRNYVEFMGTTFRGGDIGSHYFQYATGGKVTEEQYQELIKSINEEVGEYLESMRNLREEQQDDR